MHIFRLMYKGVHTRALKMQSVINGLLVVIALISAANCAKSSNTNKNQIPLATKSCDRARVVCKCNVNHDSQISEAIKKLETKMESLIALVTPKPNPPDI